MALAADRRCNVPRLYRLESSDQPRQRCGLDIDAPVIALSWQDVGSGVLAFATTALALGLAERHEPAFETTKAAALAGVVAMVFDIFVL